MPGKIFISNPINPIASSYLSMGQKIQINKNLKNQKLIHVISVIVFKNVFKVPFNVLKSGS